MRSSVFDVLGSQTRSMTWPQFLAAGMKTRGQLLPENDVDIVRAALSDAAGVADLAGLVNATLLAGFRSGADSTRDWVRTVNLPNFLAAEIATVTVAPRLELLPRGGTAPMTGFGVGSQGWRLARFAASVSVSEEDMIDNSAIGVYAVALEEIGQAARRLVPDLVFATLLANEDLDDGSPIFAVARGNLGNGALTATNLRTATAAIINRTGVDEENAPVHLNRIPRFLVVDGQGYIPACDLVKAFGDVLETRPDSRMGPAGVVNPQTDEVVSGRTGNWMLACPSDQAAGVVVGGLNGKIEPTIRHYALTAGEWGVGFDIMLDIACTVAGPESLYWSTGTGE